MFNPIICPVVNNLYLTRKAIKTFEAQDIGEVSIIVVNNGSTDGTNEFLQTKRDIAQMYFNPGLSVAESWNRALSFVFKAGAAYALVANNDTEIRPDTYRHLVNDGGGFVTAVGSRDRSKIEPPYNDPDPTKKRPHPDHSLFLIRKWVYEKVQFDESYLVAYGEDCQFHVDLHKAGITAYCLDISFLHHGAQTVKNAELGDIRRIQIQAEKNREYFFRKNGFRIGSDEYYRFFGTAAPPENERTL